MDSAAAREAEHRDRAQHRRRRAAASRSPSTGRGRSRRRRPPCIAQSARGAIAAHVEESAREQRPQRQRERERGGERVVRPPRALGPQVLVGEPVVAEQEQAERGRVQHVDEVGAVAHRRVQHQVVEHQRERKAVEQAEQQLHVAVALGKGLRPPQRKRHGQHALRLHPQVVDVRARLRRHAEAEHVVAVLHLARAQGTRRRAMRVQ